MDQPALWYCVPELSARWLVQASISDNEMFAAMIEGVEKVTNIIARYAIFEISTSAANFGIRPFEIILNHIVCFGSHVSGEVELVFREEYCKAHT